MVVVSWTGGTGYALAPIGEVETIVRVQVGDAIPRASLSDAASMFVAVADYNLSQGIDFNAFDCFFEAGDGSGEHVVSKLDIAAFPGPASGSFMIWGWTSQGALLSGGGQLFFQYDAFNFVTSDSGAVLAFVIDPAGGVTGSDIYVTGDGGYGRAVVGTAGIVPLQQVPSPHPGGGAYGDPSPDLALTFCGQLLETGASLGGTPGYTDIAHIVVPDPGYIVFGEPWTTAYSVAAAYYEPDPTGVRAFDPTVNWQQGLALSGWCISRNYRWVGVIPPPPVVTSIISTRRVFMIG